ncbi:hypothetical protein ORL93_25610 [Bacillus sp. DHT2]|uniref:hypothetical protein n=1 Tax=Bacillus sp. DHT2 TaxID=2994532 RepID=UPI002248D880|nr:hypothetical protein [Bacillus sp. DHT2]MCX2829056.1 hypothetical protein [Bacillus sp. DHT2]
MKNLIRELKNEELEKHTGGINVKNETKTDDGGHGGGPNCKHLGWLCMHGYTQQCDLVLQFCK